MDNFLDQQHTSLVKAKEKIEQELLDHIYENCSSVADIFDDSRIKLWEAIEDYSLGLKWNDEDLIKFAMDIICLQEEKIDLLMAKALDNIRDIPDYAEVEAIIKTITEDFRKQLRDIREMMERKEDTNEIEAIQFSDYEKCQFDYQHKLLLYCYLKYFRK